MSNYTFISGDTYEVTAGSVVEAEGIISDYLSGNLANSDAVTAGETNTVIYSIETESGFEPNQLHYSMDELGVCYDTDHLIMLFQELLDDGYTGLSFGLVIDLIKSRLEPVA
jgi:hypothetical protein